MITTVDTNVLLDVLLGTGRAEQGAAKLQEQAQRGELVICSVVLAELQAGNPDTDILRVLEEFQITVDFTLNARVMTEAARVWRAYTQKRRTRQSVYTCTKCGHGHIAFTCERCGETLDGAPRHILPDFLIGAYAQAKGTVLLTGERRGGLYRTFFPELTVITV